MGYESFGSCGGGEIHVAIASEVVEGARGQNSLGNTGIQVVTVEITSEMVVCVQCWDHLGRGGGRSWPGKLRKYWSIDGGSANNFGNGGGGRI